MARVYIIVFIALSAALSPPNALVQAQGHSAGDRFVAVRAGANLVGNTYRVRDRRPEPGAGGSIGTFLSPGWALEFETWVRASNPECCGPRHRETLYSLSVMRLLTAGGCSHTWSVASRGYKREVGDAGAGRRRCAVPVRPRVAMSIDLRGNGGGSTMIVRPTAALIYHFR